MSIGEALAEARHRAGLTVSQVSQRTRIRETIIRDIEADDYSSCGGDFYARGHIRSIARMVGADPEPLIREYDKARSWPPEASVAGPPKASVAGPPKASAAGPPGPLAPVRARERHWPPWSTGLVLALVAVLGFTAYYIFSASRGAGGTPAPGNRAATHANSAGARPAPGRKTTQAAGPRADRAVVHLAALRACSVEFTTPGGQRLFQSHLDPGTSKTWTFRRAVDMKLSDPAGVRLTVDGKDPLPPTVTARPVTLSLAPGRPATVSVPAAPTAPVRTLTPVSATAFGPHGGDNPQLASLAIDGSRSTAWHTDWYTTARFGNLYAGTGLLLDMGRTVTITSARVRLGSVSGARFQLRAGAAPSLAHLRVVAGASHASGAVNLRLATPARGRYVLVWFTALPPDPAGTFQASVHDVTLKGRG